MPDIELRDLNRSIGTELFADTESFLEDLSDDGANIVGGMGNNVATIVLPQSGVGTTAIRPEDMVTTTVYRPHPGGNSGINCTGLYTTVYNPPHPRHPHHPRHPRPIHPTFVTGDV